MIQILFISSDLIRYMYCAKWFVQQVTEWFKANKLLNADKTNRMVFSPIRIKYDNNFVNVFIDGEKVKHVAYTNFVGS